MFAVSIQFPTSFTIIVTPRKSISNSTTSRNQSRKMRFFPCSAVKNSKEEVGGEDVVLEGMPAEFYDEEWQARQQQKTKEWHAYRKKEEEEESRKENEYREIGMRLKGYPEEEVREARKLVSSFIRSAEEVEEKIEAAADKGELTELVLMIIRNRLDLARRDDEKDVIRSLDLLYRRIETEILKRESSPAMRLLNDLLNLHEGFDDEGWLKKCRKQMVDTFPREDPFSMLVPAGFDIENHQSRMGLPPEDDDVLLRVDFAERLMPCCKKSEKSKRMYKLHKDSILNLLRPG